MSSLPQKIATLGWWLLPTALLQAPLVTLVVNATVWALAVPSVTALTMEAVWQRSPEKVEVELHHVVLHSHIMATVAVLVQAAKVTVHLHPSGLWSLGKIQVMACSKEVCSLLVLISTRVDTAWLQGMHLPCKRQAHKTQQSKITSFGLHAQPECATLNASRATLTWQFLLQR